MLVVGAFCNEQLLHVSLDNTGGVDNHDETLGGGGSQSDASDAVGRT